MPQGSVLGPVLFLVYANDPLEKIISHVGLFVDDAISMAEISDVRDHETFQEYLDALGTWQNMWMMNFNLDVMY